MTADAALFVVVVKDIPNADQPKSKSRGINDPKAMAIVVRKKGNDETTVVDFWCCRCW